MLKPDRPGAGRDRHGQRGEDARARWRRAARVTSGVEHDRQPEPRAQREAGEQAGGDEGEDAEEAQDEAGVAGDQLGADPTADDEADELGRLDRGGHEPASSLVEVEHLLVEEAGQRREADERRRRGTAAPTRSGGGVSMRPQMRHGLAEAGRRLLGHDRLVAGAHGAALVLAPHRLLHPEAQHDDDERGDGEHEERHPPAGVEGDDPGEQRSDEGADRVGGAVEGVHLRPVLGRVVVGDERVVGGVDHGLADGRARPSDDEEPQRRRPARWRRRTSDQATAPRSASRTRGPRSA